jgi:monoamine oxidase
MNSLSRRRLLRQLFSAAIAASSAAAAIRPGTRVLVIGAGVSGLAAARQLKAAGCTVTVLEGRNRIGGRVSTDRATFGVPMELGAQFIHGKSDGRTANPIWDLARLQGWSTVPYSSSSGQTYRNGVVLTAAQDKAFGTLGDDFLDWVIDVQKDVIWGNASYSLDSALRTYALNRRLTSQQIIDLRAYLAADVEGDLGGDTTTISVQSLDEDSEFAVAGDQQITGGYDQLPKFLAAGLDVRLNCVVSAVDHTSSLVKVTTDQGDFYAEHVLVSLPLGVLKKGSVRFNPILPVAKRTAISRMKMGAFGKVLLQFPTRFWPSGNWFLNIEGTDPFGVSVSSMETVVPGKNILIAWQFGQLAEVREAMTDSQVIAIVMAELGRMFRNVAIPRPVATAITRWSKDPFSHGAYSFPVIGSPRSDITALAAPVGKRLFFAGEATYADYPGTVHGAYLSGIREAQRILSAATV